MMNHLKTYEFFNFKKKRNLVEELSDYLSDKWTGKSYKDKNIKDIDVNYNNNVYQIIINYNNDSIIFHFPVLDTVYLKDITIIFNNSIYRSNYLFFNEIKDEWLIILQDIRDFLNDFVKKKL